MSTVRSSCGLLCATLALVACGDSTDSGDNLEVEFRNFTASVAQMGETGGSTVSVAGDPMTGNPTSKTVANPGVGNSISFTVTWSGMTDTISCTVTAATAVSVPPEVVIQPYGGLDCVDW
ncbi:MAG: hypothetical protein PVJ80_14115 [Gemmatimonadota bacterium]|jgi:hypothetical protein